MRRSEFDAAALLFDLEHVVAGADPVLAANGVSSRVSVHAGSFRDDPLPVGADTISLVRVLYDHADDTVEALLEKVHAALPAGGTILVSEPMAGGVRPTRAGDAYFSIYTLAMETGRTRSPKEIGDFLQKAGFSDVQHVRTNRPFITSVVTAKKSDT